ncbi:3-deoxy-D-manno-octulosonic acid transferase, partial [bacterium]|nr:3-deoxy-D-manno-octulosonic acid transferase [bacterium]
KTFLKAKAMVQVKDSTELENEIGRLFEQSEERKLLGERSRSVVDRNRGAVARTVTMIEPFLHP